MAQGLSAWMRKLRAGALVGAAVGILSALVAYSRPMVFERGEFWTYDIRARAAARAEAASPDIVIIDISEQDIENVENNFDVTWPWPRALYGYITAYAAECGARAVIFDWLFQDRGQYSVNDAEEFAAAMNQAGNAVIGLAMTRYQLVGRATEGSWAAELGAFPTRAEATAVAVKLMAWNTRCYLVGDQPTHLFYGGKANSDGVMAAWRRMSGAEEISDLFIATDSVDASPTPPTPRQLSDAELATELTAESIIVARDGLVVAGADNLAVPQLTGMDPPLTVIAAAPARAGNVYQELEADGIMRQHTPLTRYHDRYYPSLALAAYLVAHPEVEPRVDGNTLILGDRRIELDDQGKSPIRFHGRDVYQHIEAYEVLRSPTLIDEGQPPSIAASVLKDKYVIVSASGQALRDIRVTPVSKLHQGAVIQANALDNLEAGDAIRRLSRGGDAVLAFFMCMILALGMVSAWTAIPRADLALATTVVIGAVVLGGFWSLASWLYASHGLWVGVATPAVGAGISGFTALLFTSASERRSKRFVQEALGRYTSPALVDALIEHPEYLSLEWGESREMTVYFSDIAGFTTMSEGLEPEQLVALLNDYLTNMTDLVLEHDGIVDKYIGDAVMAFWGAPLPDPLHAEKAMSCAIAMRDRLDEMRPVWLEQYGVSVRARAGLNSGAAVVGNMGSKHKYNYTAMGDMVNLASRLEGANKPYGTYLMISEFTHQRVAEHIDARELDLIVVKGKERPVKVFEVLDVAGKSDPTLMRAVDHFHTGLAAYQERKFAAAIGAFEQALREYPDDGPAKMYLERCRHFLAEPPADDWDGVWHLKEK